MPMPPAASNDMDMLTIGMNGQGNVGRADCNNYVEYEMQLPIGASAAHR